ncbi:hypothetical protein HGM15179_012841 [Zosterops borbonicus]|uniref:Retroviral nucleocapsid Gag protein p24 C-terminal domain-containing protein n=1 Tax=Zosterops borbonicus TaxID=364589 RepID=A0A8K1GA89_9PASS|nr:hypothetical protein HGM15179_012841 [Zosterops borbonicus]
MQKDSTCQSHETLVTWLLQCWDIATQNMKVDGGETTGIDREIGKRTETLSLWRDKMKIGNGYRSLKGQVTETIEGQGGSSQVAELKTVQLVLAKDNHQRSSTHCYTSPPTGTSSLTGSVSGKHWKEAILASATKQSRLPSKHVEKKQDQKFVKASSSDEESSESSLSDFEYEDHWSKTKSDAIKDNEWDIANKITAFPIMVRQGRRQARRVTWHPMPFSELKELNKAAKEHGRGSHYFRHLLETTFAAHTLLPHDVQNIIGCLLTPAEYLLWERNWKRQLATLVTAYENDANKPNLIFEQIASEGNYLKAADQFDILDSALREIASAAKASLTLTGSVSGKHWKEAILASATKQSRLPSKHVEKKQDQKFVKASSSDEESSESSLSDFEYEDHWSKTKSDAIKDNEWDIANKITAFPIMVRQGRRQARRVTWHPMPFSELKELNKAAKEHGRGSHYFRHLLETTFAAHTLLPHDVQNIIGCLLTPAEYLLWERNWKRQLATLVTAYENDANKPNLIFEQIASEGNYLKAADQFDILDSALREIASAAKASLTLVPDETVPVHSFTSIKQGVDESFTKFVDRLKAALEKQLESADARKEMLVKMALLNANSITKPILRALPLDPQPTIDQMIEVCVKHHSTENTVAQAVGPRDCARSIRDQSDLDQVLQATIQAITDFGFEIRPEKVLRTSPWKYLGLQVHEKTIKPQQIIIKTNPKTLNEVQQLCGSIN